MFKIKRNYKVNAKAFVKNEQGEYVELVIPSYNTEEVDPAQYVKGLFTDKAITKNEDGSPKEDHTMRNVLIGAAVVLAGGYYYMTHKDEPATQDYKPLPEYQPQPVQQIPVQQSTYQPVQQYQPTYTEPTYEVPTTPVETQETSTPEGVTTTEF